MMTVSNQHNKIQWQQYRLLLALFLQLDFRESHNSKGQKRRMPRMGWNLIVYLIMGLSFSAQLIVRATSAEYMFFMLVYSMTMVAFAFLVDFHSALFREEDYDILGPLPVSSKTFAWVMFSHLLVYLLMLTTALMLLPTVIMMLSPVFSLSEALIFFVISIWANIFIAAFIVALYQLWIRLFGVVQWQNTLVYIQMIFMFVLMLFYLFIARGSGFSLIGLYEQTGKYIWFIPAYWFTEIMSGAGKESALFIVLLLAVTLLFVGIAILMQSRLNASIFTLTKRQIKTRNHFSKTGFRFTIEKFLKSPEGRAGYALTRQFIQHDKQFKRGIFPLLGMPVAILIFSIWKGEQIDPFLSGQYIFESTFLTMFCFFVFFLSHALATMLKFSVDWEAGWIFWASPVNVVRLMRGVRFMVVCRLLVPLFIVLGLLFSFELSARHALMHTLTLFQTSVFIFTYFSSRLKSYPFSQKRIRGERTQRWGTLLLWLPAIVLMVLVQNYLYRQSYGWLYLNLFLFISIVSLETFFLKIFHVKFRKNIESYQIF